MAQNTLNQRAHQASRHRRVDLWRLWAVMIVFALFGAYNAFKVFDLQVLRYNDLYTRAEKLIKWKDTLQPRRGSIYDSRGQLLAGNTTAEDVYIDKMHADDEDMHRIADLLGPVVGKQPGDLYTNLKEAAGTNVRVASKLDDETTAKVRELVSRNKGLLQYKLYLDPQPLRQYPAVNTTPDGRSTGLAASVLGFTDHENVGHYGVEEFYNSTLGGEPGWIFAEHDASGRPLVLQQPEMQPAVDGADIVLTIDSAIQYLAERELTASLAEFKAESGYVVVQDPNTGGILAMVSLPGFDPNKFNEVTDYGVFRNPMVNDVREPGSTMKILTYAAGIDAGAVMSSTTFFGTACDSQYGLCNATRTAYGLQSMTMGLGRSDNVASMFVARQLGEDRFYEYLKAFGIGQRTGIDLSGEVAGLLNYPGEEGYWPINLYTNSFGQGVATTPIQLVNAVSAVANGGRLLKPHVLKEIKHVDGTVEPFETREVRRVISPETSRDIADMLSYGVENGLVARFSRVPGYHVSVKTGTAQIVSNGAYGDGSFASAMGWGPSHDAKFTLYIGILNPQSSQWGENTASVSWGRLAKELLLYLNAQPSDPLPTPTATP